MTPKFQLQNAQILSRKEQALIIGGSEGYIDAEAKKYYCTEDGVVHESLAACLASCKDKCIRDRGEVKGEEK